MHAEGRSWGDEARPIALIDASVPVFVLLPRDRPTRRPRALRGLAREAGDRGHDGGLRGRPPCHRRDYRDSAMLGAAVSFLTILPLQLYAYYGRPQGHGRGPARNLAKTVTVE